MYHLTIVLLLLLNDVDGRLISSSKFEKKRFLSNFEEHYCILKDKESFHRFNFSTLTNNTSDFKIQHDKDTWIRIQLCNELIKTCDGRNGYSVCLTEGNKEIGIGKSQPAVNFEFGDITFKYTGDKCKEDKNYSVNINLICDLQAKEAQVVSFPVEKGECDFIMDWRTNVACPEHKEINCTVNGTYGHYDLSPLKKISNNYKVPINDTYYILLNICHTVIYGQDTCLSKSAACLLNIQARFNRTLGLGEPGSGPTYNSTDKSLSLIFENGQLCNSPSKQKPIHAKTSISFYCDLNAINTLPIYTAGIEDCHFKLKWTTSVACSTEDLEKKSLKILNNNCTVENPTNGEIFNFTTIKHADFTIKPPGTNEYYQYSICGPLLKSNCSSGSGVCKKHKNESGGVANSRLMWRNNVIFLNYTTGSVCLYEKNRLRYTLIEFYCGLNRVEIEEDDLCYVVIKISTILACPKKIDTCSANNNAISFERLIRNSDNYKVETNDSIFYINVCQPVVSKKNFECASGAGICQLLKGTGIPNKVINLGFSNQSVIYVTDSSIILSYYNGSFCGDNINRRITSNISFICDIDSNEGMPRFEVYKDCTYFFKWKTSIVCGKNYGYFNDNNCTISNSFGDIRNLSSIFTESKNHTVNVDSNYVKNKYRITFCGDKSTCDGGFICNKNMSYGSKASVYFNYVKNLIRFSFSEGSLCKDGALAKSTITVICDKESSPFPLLLEENSCSSDFEWHTSQICKYVSESDTLLLEAESSANISIIGDDQNSLNDKAIWIFLVALVISLILYFKNASRRKQLLDGLSRIFSRYCDRVRYSRVSTMEEVHLLNDSDLTDIDSSSNSNDDCDVIEA